MISNRHNLSKFIESVRHLECSNFFDIGSRDGDDAHLISSSLNIEEVYIFEPIPDSAQYIKNRYPKFRVQEVAISNEEGISPFFAISDPNVEQRGISSLRDRVDGVYKGRTNLIKVITKRFDTWCKEQCIGNVDLVKLDVEGCTYEALESFGDLLKIVKAIHLEVETTLYWEGQKLKRDVDIFMSDNFKLINEWNCGGGQFDQVWINRDL